MPTIRNGRVPVRLPDSGRSVAWGRGDDRVCVCTGGEAEPSGEYGPRGSRMNLFRIGPIFAVMLALLAISRQPGLTAASNESRLLYVASPGIRNYVEYGGVGVLVYDIGAGHRWVKRIPTPEIQDGQTVENVKGICASAKTGRLYVSTIKRLLCLDLLTDRLLWNRTYEGGCDRMSISPDGKTIYLPTLEKDDWHVVSAMNGDVIATIP